MSRNFGTRRLAGALTNGFYRFLNTAQNLASFTHANTADRTYTLPDETGTLLITSNLPRSYLTGLGTSIDSGDTTNDIGVAVGEARNSTDASDMALGSAIVKRIDAAWAVGTGNGGLDGTESVGGTPDNDTWYHIYLIMRTDTGVVDALFSENATSPSQPTDYDRFRRIGAVRRGTAANVGYTQIGDEFLFDNPPLSIDATDPGTSAVTRILLTPGGHQLLAFVNVFIDIGSVAVDVYLSSLDQDDEAPSGTAAPLMTVAGSGHAANAEMASQAHIRTDTSSSIRSRLGASDAATRLLISTLGWYDTRGRDA